MTGPSSAEGAINYYIHGTNWAPDRRAAAVAAMDSAVARYNAYGVFNKTINVYYEPGVPTADASYNGTLRFGGTWPNERVSMHEISHTLGVGTTSNYANLMTGGTWDGPRANALIKQFEGLQVTSLMGDGAHIWPYGLNYDSEAVPAVNIARHVAVLYAMRGDMNIGPTAAPSTATAVTLTASNALGTSGFNYATGWSDGHFAHSGGHYSTGNFSMRTPASANSFDFAGESLTVNNAGDPANGGLYYKGAGATGVISFKNLVLNGGTVHHLSAAGDLFQLDGKVTAAGNGSIFRAAQGSMNVLADVTGNADLTIADTAISDPNNGVVRFLSNANTFTGNLNVAGRFELGSGANHRFVIGANGQNNRISGPAAKRVTLNGVFDIDLTGASDAAGDSWALVTAANRSFGGTFNVSGFTPSGSVWTKGDYVFSPSTGMLSVVPVVRAWASAGSGNWSTAAAWSTGTVPTATHSILLGNAIAQDATITISSGGAVAATTVNTPRTYTIDLAAGGPTAFRAGNLNVQAGTLALTAGGDNTLRASGLTLASTGATLSLADNAFILDYAGTSPIAVARSMIASGKIIAATDDANRLAYAEASALLGPGGGTFGNAAISGDAILFRLALAGDANINGIVNFEDLVALARNYNTAGAATWTGGDFNYNGTVNFEDLVTLARNYNRGMAANGELTASFQADWALAMSVVPEPASALSLAVLAAALAPRRRQAEPGNDRRL